MARQKSHRATNSDTQELQAQDLELQSVPEKELWAFKRACQAKDLRSIAEGKSEQADSIWFTPEFAQRLKAVDSPF